MTYDSLYTQFTNLMYPARNTPIKTCSGIIHGLIQPSLVYLKNQRIQNNEHVFMYKYMLSAQIIIWIKAYTCSKLKKHSNTIMYIVQVFWSNQFLNIQINVYYLVVIFLIRLFIPQYHTDKQAILSTKSNRVPPFQLMICNNN